MLPQTFTLQACDGKLYIVERTPNYYEPQWDILWWPTGLYAHRYEEHIGKTLYRSNSAPGCYCDHYGYGALWRLENGGQTTATWVEHEPIARPKTKVDCEYHHGAWHKYLKGKGWVEVTA